MNTYHKAQITKQIQQVNQLKEALHSKRRKIGFCLEQVCFKDWTELGKINSYGESELATNQLWLLSRVKANVKLKLHSGALEFTHIY